MTTLAPETPAAEQSGSAERAEGRWGRWADPLIRVGLALLPFLFFWRIFASNPADRLAFAWGDFTQVFYPFRAFVSAELKAGRLPLWNPYINAGQPALADSQLAVLYPLSWLATLWSPGRPLAMTDLQLEAVLHFALTGVFTYLFARQILASRRGALIAALTFTYGGYLTAYPVLQLGILEADTWLPFILFAFERGFRRDTANGRGLVRFSLLAGLGLALAITVGHPQSLAYVTAVSALYLLWRARNAGWSWRRAAGAMMLWLAVGLGMSAAQWLPTLEFLRLTPRADSSYDWAAGGLALRDLAELLLPGLTSRWYTLYIGVVPLLLAGLALTAWRSRPQVRFWALVGLAGLILSFGGHTFAYDLLYLATPVLRLFRSQERTSFVFSFAAALLAGIGADLMAVELEAGRAALRRAQIGARGLIAAGLGLALLAGGAWLLAGRAPDDPFSWVMDRGVFIALLAGLALGLLALWGRGGLGRPVFALLLAGLVGLDLFTTNGRKPLEPPPQEGYYPVVGAVAAMQTDSAGPFRVSSEGLFPGDGNASMVYRVEDVTGNSPLHQAAYDSFIEKVNELRWWHLLNVKYILTRRQFPPGELTLVRQGARGNLYRLESAWPRAWVVTQSVQAENNAEAYRLLSAPEFDPQQAVVLYEPVPAINLSLIPSPAREGETGERSSVTAIWSSPGRLSIDVATPDAAFLVVSEVYTPGWQAFVDGRRVPLWRADAVLQAVLLPTGARHVELIYLPVTFVVGALVSLGTLVAAAVIWWRAAI